MTEQPSLFELHQQAGGDPDQYRRLMIAHGHLIPREPTLSAATVAKMEQQMEAEIARLRDLVPGQKAPAHKEALVPRYKLRVPGPGTWLYGDGPSAVVADTIQDARVEFEDNDGEPAIYLSSYIGSCRVVYKRDVEAMDCHEDADPGDTTVDYLADDGRELRDHEVRVWVRGWQGPISLVNRDTPAGLFEEMPPGVKVEHPVWGWGTTVARPLKHRTGWRVLVDFGGLYAGAPFPGAAGGIGGSPRWVGWWSLKLTQSRTSSGLWPADRWHVDVGDERIAEGIADKAVAEALGDARVARLRAEWEAEQFAAWEREQAAVTP